jgi:hypothetical protein
LLKSELYQLEKYVGDILSKEQEENTNRHPGKLEAELRNVQTLCHSLKTKWVHELFSSVKEHVIQRYVQYHQAGLTSLSNQISRRLASDDFQTANNIFYLDGYRQLLSDLESLLYFFKHSFYKYFDLDYKITVYQCHRKVSEFNEFAEDLKEPANLRPSLTPLISVLLSSIGDLYEEAHIEGISYRQAEHAVSLIRTAFHMLNVIKDIAPEDLAKSLYKQNFNTLYFFNWYKDFLTARISLSAREIGNEKAIKEEITALENLFVDPAKNLEPELPSIDFMIINWLKEQAPGKEQAVPPETTKKFTNGQLALNLSVAQFAMFIRIFYQAGCFPINNVSKLMRFFTYHFTSKKQSDISFKSFSKAFYGADQSAAATIRDYLQRMLNYVNKTYFP